jgi:hypothetical protein
MPKAYADHEIPTRVPTVTIEDRFGKRERSKILLAMVTVGTIAGETVAK